MSSGDQLRAILFVLWRNRDEIAIAGTLIFFLAIIGLSLLWAPEKADDHA
jgi:hypothetical protein